MSYAYGPYIKGDISSLSEIAISSPKLKKVGTYYIHISLCKKISNSEKKSQNKEKDESQYMMVKVINWQINRIAAA